MSCTVLDCHKRMEHIHWGSNFGIDFPGVRLEDPLENGAEAVVWSCPMNGHQQTPPAVTTSGIKKNTANNHKLFVPSHSWPKTNRGSVARVDQQSPYLQEQASGFTLLGWRFPIPTTASPEKINKKKAARHCQTDHIRGSKRFCSPSKISHSKGLDGLDVQQLSWADKSMKHSCSEFLWPKTAFWSYLTSMNDHGPWRTNGYKSKQHSLAIGRQNTSHVPLFVCSTRAPVSRTQCFFLSWGIGLPLSTQIATNNLPKAQRTIKSYLNPQIPLNEGYEMVQTPVFWCQVALFEGTPWVSPGRVIIVITRMMYLRVTKRPMNHLIRRQINESRATRDCHAFPGVSCRKAGKKKGRTGYFYHIFLSNSPLSLLHVLFINLKFKPKLFFV